MRTDVYTLIKADIYFSGIFTPLSQVFLTFVVAKLNKVQSSLRLQVDCSILLKAAIGAVLW